MWKEKKLLIFLFSLGDHVKQIKRLDEEDTKKLIPEVKRYKSEAIYVSCDTNVIFFCKCI